MNEIKRLLKSIPPVIWYILAICFLIICFLPAAITQLPSIIDFTETGQIGDTIGGIMGPFIAVVAALLTFIAFWVQFEANKELIQENRRNHFENRFYKMLDIHLDNVASLDNNVNKKKSDLEGSIFNHWCNMIENTYNHLMSYNFEVLFSDEKMKFQNDSKEQDYISFLNNLEQDVIVRNALIFEIVYALFFTGDASTVVFGNGSNSYNASRFSKAFIRTWRNFIPEYKPKNELLGRYYRHLYQIVKFVDTQDDKLFERKDWKKEYVGMLRSQMSDYEQLLLYYNAQSTFGRAWDEHSLIAGYRMIRNIPHDKISSCAGVPPSLRYQIEIEEAGKKGELFFERM